MATAHYNVEHQSIETLEDNRLDLILLDGGRKVSVVACYSEVHEVGIDRFLPDSEGGCSIYRPALLRSGESTNVMVNGSMALMIKLGWLPADSIGGFEDLTFDNYARTGAFAVAGSTETIQIRFGKKEDLNNLQSAVVKISDWSSSWPVVTLESGFSFRGQARLALEEAANLGLLGLSDEDEEKLKLLISALEAKDAAKAAYQAVVNEVGGVFCDDGSYEDYRSWYEVPGVPGTW